MSSAQLIDHLKKADMAKEAERLLDGSGWLPEPLRLVDIVPAAAEQDGEAGPLPEFLADDEDQEASATTIGHSSMPLNDVPSQDGSAPSTLGGPVLSAGPHFYWRWLRARGGPGRV